MEPLPPVKEVEYRCIIGKLFDELSGSEFTTFSFETAKEFSNFRYEIAVRYRIAEGQLEFKVLGMTATRTMMPAFGTAKSVLKIPHLPLGIYTVLLIKSDGTENIFTIEFTKKGFQILAPVPRKRFIDVVISPSASLPGAKITSTVSKTPPVPLVPRTIQKRQPPPPTPEELAILESLKSETPEERDAREERELFGDSNKGKRAATPKEPDAPEKPAHAPKAAPAAEKPHAVTKATPAKATSEKAAPVKAAPVKAAPVKAAPEKPVKKAAPAKAAPAKSAAKEKPAKPAAKKPEKKAVYKPAKPAKVVKHKPAKPAKAVKPAKKSGKKK
ncbi:MAG: hypothetical protein ABI444_09070 [Candidatus Kapaibacterium sp.]|jgi:hypothetical protein